ncbi:hypothetical protein PHYBLDRAFT_58831 [Phycomyces blakesleeanus NRRL 1555(-)]|uniref:Uncharacterized protein n=1 Tax=Phycomyces blakesleeanus (strain ATCC 8743b / DSM 1359 / FGSC 10004 / NBRC 33097 / NRRL 1555) TaxID=763407 RepID=A0A167QJA7_PHYB8|nr:hypothetical protein PHYBLDRAFT_58831 [Phycomyces blakesleeanus NRRL 1555(-)]OAD79784.1 hypothetical protein PHYBLDRAFT_58831 [Phycomyces blakesleeanus NRRL 1555(-)]|eukprot:XP_018297824.1 hypothetical protein PHYBLDRAFT_58831 [Phycomyces blakesleeanus NRRL 1555(-)]
MPPHPYSNAECVTVSKNGPASKSKRHIVQHCSPVCFSESGKSNIQNIIWTHYWEVEGIEVDIEDDAQEIQKETWNKDMKDGSGGKGVTQKTITNVTGGNKLGHIPKGIPLGRW